MRVLQIQAPRKCEIVDRPVPQVQDNEVLVEVKACVTCPHWDITLWTGVDIFERPGYPRYPIPAGFPGHEVSGVVVKIGRAVRNFRTGDRVATLVDGGTESPGFYAEYVSRPEDTVAKLPDFVSYESGASLEMANCLAPFVRRLGNLAGKRVGVTGVGPAGLLAVQMLGAVGAAEVVAMDVLPERLELARKSGATETVNTGTPEGLQALQAKPLQACVDCSGRGAALQTALDHTQGLVAVFGVIHGEAKLSTRHWLQGLSIVTCLPRTPEDTTFMLDMLAAGKLNAEALVSARLPFERYAEGVQLLIDKQAIKVCFYPK